MTVAEVKEWLVRYRKGERKLYLQEERLATLLAKMYNPGSPEMTDMPKAPSPSTDRTAPLLQRKEDLEKRIDAISQRQEAERKKIENLVDSLTDPDQQAVIQFRYLDGEEWETVNRMMFGSDEEFEDRLDSFMRRVFNLHGEALKEMAARMNKAGV